MNFLKKPILWFMMLGMVIVQVQADDKQQNSSHVQMSSSTQADLSENTFQSSYFTKVANYLESDRGISQIFNLTGGLAVSVGLAFFYLYLQQETQDMAGNQTMKIYYPGDIDIKLADVAGLTGAKADMQDVISYLENSKKYHDIGANIPKGVLMNGLPGNGKTLLAKAFAGEINCPFISVSGSSFVQMFVGLGAARVRNLFATAQKLSDEHGGCIIFIDEIDAVAQKRSSFGSDREHDQTVAQLLQCMDGLDKQDNPIVVLGATNRVELLDSAIVRAGRFDRRIEITKPFVKDRVKLLDIALKNVAHCQDIDIDRIVSITGGFSGAELVNLINESAILAVADGRSYIENEDVELAFDHITLGRAIEGMDQSDESKWKTAIHEAGHAVGWLFGDNIKHAVHKASITPRSHTLGVVWATPLYESYESTEAEMRARIVVLLCGGLAEQEFNFGKSTGISNDLSKARAIAYDMVVKYGMSEKLNYLSYDEIDRNLPNDIATEVHREVQKIIDECFVTGKNLVTSCRKEVEAIAQLLMDKGTVLGDEIYDLVGLPTPSVN